MPSALIVVCVRARSAASIRPVMAGPVVPAAAAAWAAGGYQDRDSPGHLSGRAAGGRVDLDPVTSGQNDHLVDLRHNVQPDQHVAQLRGRNGKHLQHLGCTGPVRQAQAHNRHRIDRPLWDTGSGWMRAGTSDRGARNASAVRWLAGAASTPCDVSGLLGWCRL
jgi:hypothetical protein